MAGRSLFIADLSARCSRALLVLQLSECASIDFHAASAARPSHRRYPPFCLKPSKTIAVVHLRPIVELGTANHVNALSFLTTNPAAANRREKPLLMASPPAKNRRADIDLCRLSHSARA